jgi:hypothetical protein
MAYNSSTHTITAIVYDNQTGMATINSANPTGANGYSVHTINLSAKTWTKSYNTATLGLGGTITTGSPVSFTWQPLEINVYILAELEAQQLSITGENFNAQTAAQVAVIQANITDLNSYVNLGLNAGTVWNATSESYPTSGGTNPLTPGTDGEHGFYNQ